MLEFFKAGNGIQNETCDTKWKSMIPVFTGVAKSLLMESMKITNKYLLGIFEHFILMGLSFFSN